MSRRGHQAGGPPEGRGGGSDARSRNAAAKQDEDEAEAKPSNAGVPRLVGDEGGWPKGVCQECRVPRR